MLRMLISGTFLLAFLMPSAGAVDFDARYRGTPAVTSGRADTRTLIDFVHIVTEAGLYDLALSALERHLSRDPDDAEAQLLAAQTYQRLGLDEMASRHAELALQSGRLDETQMRRAAFLRAAVTRRTDSPAPLTADLRLASDPLQTVDAGTGSRSATSSGENDALLRRIYGDAPRENRALTRIAAFAPSGNAAMLPLLALTEAGPGEETAVSYGETAAGPSRSRTDLSLRYTFVLY